MENTPSLDSDARLPVDIAGLDRLSNPIWVFDPVRERKLYANPSAVALWGAPDLASLQARDFSSKSESARIRTERTLTAVLAGERLADVWTFYPNGEPVSVRTVSSHLLLNDGSSAILFEAAIADEPADYIRALSAVRHTRTIVSLYALDGAETFGNPQAVTIYGSRRSFLERCADRQQGTKAWSCAISSGEFRGRLSMRTEGGEIWHDVTLHKTVDPVTGNPAVLAYEADDSQKVEDEVRLALQACDLDRARKAAEAANEAKSAFVANMSHEIRTPLNGVVSLADLLCQSDLTGPQKEAAELIRSSGRSLEHLLDGVLQLARIEAGEVELAEAPFDPRTVAREVTDLLRLKAEENGSTISLITHTPAGQLRLGDASRFRQILTNLTSNAVKFTARGSVVVTIEESGEGIQVCVEDTGVGFDAEQKGRIFERFQQADVSITRRFGGSGLGLAITSELVERMGGQIGCASEPGIGSRFWAILPLPVAANDSVTTRVREPSGDLIDLRVLVADDHPVNRRVFEMILAPLGVDLVSVENGAEAVAAIEHSAFDIVLMDMQMPVMDGLEATRLISAAGGPPVIMVSANGMPEHVEAAQDAGARAHIVKPITPGSLIETIWNVLVEGDTAMSLATSSGTSSK